MHLDPVPLVEAVYSVLPQKWLLKLPGWVRLCLVPVMLAVAGAITFVAVLIVAGSVAFFSALVGGLAG